jgi:hypothetical protein
VFLVFRLGSGGGKDDAAGSQPISERQNGNRPNRLRGLDMPRDFPPGAMLDGRRKDTKDLSFFFLTGVAWLCFGWHLFSVAGTRGCISHASTELEQPAWSKRIWAKSASVSVRAQSRRRSPAMSSQVVSFGLQQPRGARFPADPWSVSCPRDPSPGCRA